LKYTVTLPPLPGATSDVFLVTEWRKEIGEMVAAGDTLAVLRAGDTSAETPVPSPAFGILSRKVVLAGEAIETGEPLAVLAGVPESLLTGEERVPDAFAARPPYVPGGPEEVVTLTPTQRAVSEHMSRSAQASPHVYTFTAVDVGEVLRLAARIEADLLPFVVGAVASALTRHPEVNAERTGEGQVRRKRYVHIGVALRTDAGELSVPVVRDADRKSVRALAREVAALIEQARAGTLPPDALRGATFTVSAEGGAAATGVRIQTPILHQPQAALLRLGTVERTPVAVSEDRIEARPVLHLCLAHDARVVPDGAAAAFLADVKAELEEARFLFTA
jgi:pyruvate/2-oxoglutarate dehydrogenase complex dihydrolipoamide acyltransferase (E2) component